MAQNLDNTITNNLSHFVMQYACVTPQSAHGKKPLALFCDYPQIQKRHTLCTILKLRGHDINFIGKHKQVHLLTEYLGCLLVCMTKLRHNTNYLA